MYMLVGIQCQLTIHHLISVGAQQLLHLTTGRQVIHHQRAATSIFMDHQQHQQANLQREMHVLLLCQGLHMQCLEELILSNNTTLQAQQQQTKLFMTVLV